MPLGNPPPYLDLVRQAAAENKVPADLLAAQLQSESNFDPNAVSPAGAQGIGQFMPTTWSGSWNPYRSQSVNDPHAAIRAAALYLARLNKQLPGGWNEALAGYNAGPNAVLRAGGVPNIGETRSYIRTVNARRARFPGLATSDPPDTIGFGSQPERQPARVPSTTTAPDTASGGGGRFDGGLAAAQGRQAFLQNLVDQTSRIADLPALNVPLGDYTAPTDITVPTQTLTHPEAPEPQLPSAVGKQAQHAITLAKEFMGTPYQWGGTTPKGFDCSGYVQYVYGKVGVNLPRTTYEQIKVGTPVAFKDVKPGDILFFGTPDDPHHEGMAIGGGKFIHAPHTGDVVKVSSLADPYYSKAFVTGRRVN